MRHDIIAWVAMWHDIIARAAIDGDQAGGTSRLTCPILRPGRASRLP